ncbi:hypothetical protein [Fimbriiglobus ruber]|uniref:Uncharacterized protein n=2 Tax=Fimbriiglobus ruber TaxID=1908690 RepID=A0A225DSZ2_9BACT|nr:hypothetical protein [Fimbriiglobus ruber]OWK40289.1 hypothetical protein FRUB_05208 [Fimbriiglobus ruber]
MRWTVNGAAAVAALRAIYQSGPAFWDGFWATHPRTRPAATPKTLAA